ncbi:hypothetical protein GGR34_001323 [Microvirga flocculans]|uniref:DUF1795 domain-containing protein n=1 Tax=Microvirga flocculans TaxID=217168 RepID=A0A7W6IDV6_9HYPH|nr:hypothetical protein [Microvirga flocculans]MBB4039681.1 hypothetical protein [Microvirga flocculans]
MTAALALNYASEAVAQPTKSPIPSHAEQIDGYPFPKSIAGLLRGQRTDYDEPGLGFSVRYERPGETWADIFIYDLGESLSSVNARKMSLDQRDAALRDIDHGVSSGSYQNAALVAKSETTSYAKAHVAITQGGKTRDSYVFVTIHKGNFIKIRLTTAADNADELASRFASEYARIIGRK